MYKALIKLLKSLGKYIQYFFFKLYRLFQEWGKIIPKTSWIRRLSTYLVYFIFQVLNKYLIVPNILLMCNTVITIFIIDNLLIYLLNFSKIQN